MSIYRHILPTIVRPPEYGLPYPPLRSPNVPRTALTLNKPHREPDGPKRRSIDRNTFPYYGLAMGSSFHFHSAPASILLFLLIVLLHLFKCTCNWRRSITSSAFNSTRKQTKQKNMILFIFPFISRHVDEAKNSFVSIWNS